MMTIEQAKWEAEKIQKSLAEVREALDYDGLAKKAEELRAEQAKDNFWDDMENAQKINKDLSRIESKMKHYDKLYAQGEDLEVLIELTEDSSDEGAMDELQKEINSFSDAVEALKLETLLKGKYDANNAILTLHAGAGGTEAQDWANMLYRMYTRYAERVGYKVVELDKLAGDEAGIKSVTFKVIGENAYGYLKAEKGVHRLVRISPYDSSGRRHTSFASVDVMPEINDEITVEIDPEDLRIDTFRSSGAGGQHVNKTDSAIRITHIPTNIVVSCQNERSQHQNREMAMRMLKSKLMELAEQEHKENLKELKGDFSQITWGSQIRSYVFHPYTMVKDHRTGAEVGNVDKVLDGDLDYFINEELKQKI